MYNEHFGLKQSPFRITPDTRLFFPGGGRGDILDALVYAITSGEGIIKVVGEVGSGKTMLCRMLEERLPENVEIVYLANPSLSPDDILQAIALEMNLSVPDTGKRLQVMHALEQRLVEKHAKNRQVVVFIEEAQSMPIETLEEIRLLSNLETKREKLLQIVLFGQPELDENLDQPNIRQLRERITHSFHLDPLSRDELRDYVNHRMRAVGYRGPDVFRPNAFQSLARASEGLTRRINILADKALLSAFAEDRHDVIRKDVQKAITDSQFERKRPTLAPQLTMGLGVVMMVGAVAWTLFDRSQSPAQTLLASAGPDVTASLPQPPAAASVSDRPAASAEREESAVNSASGGGPPASSAVTPAKMPAAAAATQTKVHLTSVVSDPVAAKGPETGPVASPEPAASRRNAEAVASPPVADEPPDQISAEGTPAMPAETQTTGATEETSAPGDQTPEPVEAASDFRPEETNPEAAPEALLDQRIEVTRTWLRSTNREHFSIQLLLTARSQRRHLETFLERQARRQGIQNVYVYETVIDDRPYLGVLYGEFPTLTAAREALDNLPPALKRLGPFIRNVRDISAVG